MKSYLWEPLEDKKVQCSLCSHRCVIKDGRRGICAVRENRGGILNTLVYGNLVARHIDPIEKKPLFHFLPDTLSYSIATVGCNYRCRFCQNADIAQMPTDHQGTIMGSKCTPREVVQAAEKGGCMSISYTYTEPTVFFEFAFETARLGHEKGLRNVFVTNGYMTAEALEMISPYLDAANVDLKAFSDQYYKDYCSARLKHVLATLKLMKTLGIFVEVTTLIVPGLNDDPDELKDLAAFIIEDLGPETPWHISRFHPTYKLTDRPATPVATLAAAREIGLNAGLKYVYTGNVPGDAGENTYCNGCGEPVIERWGFRVGKLRMDNGRCNHCGAEIDGVWK
ncbi:MAG: AmmeMemoRadiSam system radical SAM enzyme [Desulfobacterales bacterium]|jgi:pyruvate formate lyase activating enzyme